MSSTQSSFFDSLVSAVRENPLAATLIGGGALWLLAGNEKLKSAADGVKATASPMVDAAVRNLGAASGGLKRAAAPPTAPDLDHSGSFSAADTFRDAGNAAADAVSEAAAKVTDRFSDGIAYTRENLSNLTNPLRGSETFANAKSSLADVLERQPLVLGAIGLAVGAVVAGAFATSALENEWLGEASDGIKADLNTRVGSVSQSLREASDTLKAELGDTGIEAVDRVKQAAQDATNAAREKMKS
jgi:hypothetical protein